jgi:hypothetical protein
MRNSAGLFFIINGHKTQNIVFINQLFKLKQMGQAVKQELPVLRLLTRSCCLVMTGFCLITIPLQPVGLLDA